MRPPPDSFPYSDDHVLAETHAFLAAFLIAREAEDYGYCYDLTGLEDHETILALGRDEMASLVQAASEQYLWYCDRYDTRNFRAGICTVIIRHLIRRKLPFDAAGCLAVVHWAALCTTSLPSWIPFGKVADIVEMAMQEHESETLREAVGTLLENMRAYDSDAGCRKATTRIKDCLGFEPALPVDDSEVWSKQVLDDLAAMPAQQRGVWQRLLELCSSATSSKPSAKWLKHAHGLLGAESESSISPADFTTHCIPWLNLADKHGARVVRTTGYDFELHELSISDEHQNILRGLVWLSTLCQNKELGRAVASLAVGCYNKKIPGIGPRAPRIGNACVWALGMFDGLDGVGHLAYLKVRVRYGTAQKMIDKALNRKAEDLGIARDELDEMGVPDYGLTRVGGAEIAIGDFTALVQIESGSAVSLRWRQASGKEQKSVPAKVKSEHAEELKELKGSIKDLQKMLPAQRDRIDSLFLAQRQWAYQTWRERYADHPLVGYLGRRLIWCAQHGEQAGEQKADQRQAFLFHDGQATDVHGQPCTLDETTHISLWHPIDWPAAAIMAWRERLQQLEIVQPFKQAHRELYLLTDAERNTETYSNRFAAHIIRQHQFNALCGTRGWRNKLRLSVDDEYPPAYKELPQWGLRAEFWIEGIGEEWGTDINDSGVYLYLTTDQVRFYRDGATMATAHAGGGGYAIHHWHGDDERVDSEDPLPMADIPPLVLTEILRDVDLFVGVGSIGNDPTWVDGGGQTRHNDYWHRYNTAELGEQAKNRKLILENLVPKLAIGAVCTFSDRYLHVQGTRHSYKIHLGSGNIMIEPNDRYLCIVARQSTKKSDQIMLPFEGDNMLSIILSKALLLAQDDKITDKTILSQLR